MIFYDGAVKPLESGLKVGKVVAILTDTYVGSAHEAITPQWLALRTRELGLDYIVLSNKGKNFLFDARTITRPLLMHYYIYRIYSFSIPLVNDTLLVRQFILRELFH